MQKPYYECFNLTYNGIVQFKRFTNVKNKNNKNQSARTQDNKNDVSEDIQKAVVYNSASINENDSKHYTINKSKVKNRAIAFSRLTKSRKQFFFYTVTFPSGLSDALCYETYNIFLTRLRSQKYMQNYLWVAERQKNGTIHFHYLTNDYYPVFKANQFIKSSLIYKLNRKEFDYDRKAIENYNGVHLAKHNNSSKVINFAKSKNPKLLISYLTKYIVKNDTEMNRLPFHSSHSIANLTHKYLIDSYTADSLWNQYQQYNMNPRTFHHDFCSIYYFDNSVSSEIFELIDIKNEKIFAGYWESVTSISS